MMMSGVFVNKVNAIGAYGKGGSRAVIVVRLRKTMIATKW